MRREERDFFICYDFSAIYHDNIRKLIMATVRLGENIPNKA